MLYNLTHHKWLSLEISLGRSFLIFHIIIPAVIVGVVVEAWKALVSIRQKEVMNI